MPAFDALLMFHTVGAVTQSQSSSALTIHGTGIKGVAARVIYPITGTQTMPVGFILPRYWVSRTGVAGTWHIASIHPAGAAGGQVFPNRGLDLITPLITDYKYVAEELVVIATTATLLTGVIQSGIVTGVGYDWSRAVYFE